MDFQIQRHVAVPQAAIVANANAHTFPWDAMEEALRKDPTDRPYILVPKEYWEERKVAKDKMTAERARARILMHFGTWKKAEGQETRKELMLLTRANAETGAVGVWMQFDPKVNPAMFEKLVTPAAPAGSSAQAEPPKGTPAKK